MHTYTSVSWPVFTFLKIHLAGIITENIKPIATQDFQEKKPNFFKTDAVYSFFFFAPLLF